MVNLIIVSYVKNISSSWRILTNTVLIPTVPLLVLIYLMPESPRYLMKHGRYRKALEAFTAVQTTPLLASRDLMYAHVQLDFESRLLNGDARDERGNLAERIAGSHSNLQMAYADRENTTPQPVGSRTSSRRGRDAENTLSVNHVTRPRDSHQQSTSRDKTARGQDVELSGMGRRGRRRGSDSSSLDTEMGRRRVVLKDNPYFYHIGVTGYFKRLGELWSNMRCRRALLSASVAMISQQMTGINTIAFLGTTVWENSLNTTSSPKTTAVIGLFFGAANYLGGLPAYWLSDKIGRSILLALGLPNMAWSMLVFALLFQIPDGSPTRVPLVSIFAVIFR
jgi:hypothetical protein